MKVLSNNFEIDKQDNFTNYENDNILSRNIIILLIKMKNQLNEPVVEYLMDSEAYFILEHNSSFSWNSKQHPNPIHFINSNEGYYYGGPLLGGSEIYYDYNINKIYCSIR